MNSWAEGTKTTPLGNWEERPGAGRDVIMCSPSECAHYVLKCAQCLIGCWTKPVLAPGAGRVGLEGGLRPSSRGVSPRHAPPPRQSRGVRVPSTLTQMVPPVTGSPESQAQHNLREGVFSYHEKFLVPQKGDGGKKKILRKTKFQNAGKKRRVSGNREIDVHF